MTRTIFLLTTLALTVCFKVVSQNVSFSGKDVPLEKVFTEVEKQTPYLFLYTKSILTNSKPVTLDVKNMPLRTFLDVLFRKQPLKYSIESRTIHVTVAGAEKVTGNGSSLQSLPVKGSVLDPSGNPLVGATVVVKGRRNSVVTDGAGLFSLEGKAGDVLLVSYVGYETRSVIVSPSDNLVITLQPSVSNLEDVEVTYSTGYQDIPKERATGSFVKIDNKLLSRTVSTNILDRIKEITNSLKVERNRVGDNGSEISIRGFSTINANMKPLIVVDGFVYEEQGVNAIFSGVSESVFLNNLNPNDIENITILRDAAAASIWGARSGNGVIVINTKKGRYNQKVNVSFNSSINIIEKPRIKDAKLIDPMDAINFEKNLFASGIYNDYDDLYPGWDMFPALSPAVEIMLAARKANISNPSYNVLEDAEVIAQLNELGRHDARNDIGKYILRTAVNQQYSLNISGGNEKTKYYGSIGYDNNLPVSVGNKNSRFTIRFDNTYRPVKKLELNTYLVYTNSTSVDNAIGFNYLGTGSVIAPYTAFADASGRPLHVSLNNGSGYRTTYLDTVSYPGLLDWHYRPIDEIKNGNNSVRLYSTRLGGGIKYRIVPAVSLEVTTQYEKELSGRNTYNSLKMYNTRNFINEFMYVNASGQLTYPVPLGGMLIYTNAEREIWNIRAKLMLDRVWNRHHINAIAGAEAQEATYDFNGGAKYGYDPNTSTFDVNVDHKNIFPRRASGGSSGSISYLGNIGGTLDRFISYFANAGYTLDNKYTLTASARADASNFFGAKVNQKITPLWSSGVAWHISREKFFHVKWLSHLLLAVTYGYNANLNNKATPLPTIQYNPPASGYYNNEIYAALITPPNPGLTWERVRNINFRVDYGILNSRINGSLEYYIKRGINLIGDVVVEPTVGRTNYTGNYASMTSGGLDLQLNTLNTTGKLKWNTLLNLSYNTDKITDYEITEFSKNWAGYYLNEGALVLGKPRLKIYSYADAGLDPVNGNPRGYINGEAQGFNEVLLNVKPSDLLYHGSATPKLFGSFINTFEYKNFSLSFNIVYRFDYFFRKTSVRYNSMFSNWGNAHADYALRWQKPGDELFTSVPSLPLNYDGRDEFYLYSNNLILKGDHIRLNDIRLAYNLDKSVIKRIPFTNASVYLYVNNPGIIIWRANKEGIDPDYPDNTQAPVSRSLAIGLNFNF